MNLKVEIRRNSDGEISQSVWSNWEWSGSGWWDEGNAGCDCNREIFFLRGNDQSTDDAMDATKCSEGRYAVRLSDADSGIELWSDFAKWPLLSASSPAPQPSANHS